MTSFFLWNKIRYFHRSYYPFQHHFPEWNVQLGWAIFLSWNLWSQINIFSIIDLFSSHLLKLLFLALCTWILVFNHNFCFLSRSVSFRCAGTAWVSGPGVPNGLDVSSTAGDRNVTKVFPLCSARWGWRSWTVTGTRSDGHPAAQSPELPQVFIHR